MKTGLKILSVLMIIIGVLALFIGLPIVVLMLGATDGSAGGNAVVVLATAMTLASGVFEIVGGVLGFRAADLGKGRRRFRLRRDRLRHVCDRAVARFQRAEPLRQHRAALVSDLRKRCAKISVKIEPRQELAPAFLRFPQ